MGKLAIVAWFLCAVFALGTASGGNLLLNPGFEDGSWTNEGDWPDHYWQWLGGDGWAVWKSESLETQPDKIQHPRTGDKCISVGGMDPGSFGSWGQSIPITGGRAYVLSAWVDVEDWSATQTGELIIGWRDNTELDEWGDPLSLGDTIGVIDFGGVDPQQYVYFEIGGTAPATANQADVMFRGYPWGSLLMDDASFDYDVRASNPIPPDGEGVTPDISELSWTNPVPRNPEDTITCDVWFSENYPEYGKYEGDPNFLNYAIQLVDNDAVESVSLDSVTIVPEHYYYWRVDCYDPNLIDNPELYPAIGKVWMFNTCNVRPQVEAGVKQKAWLSDDTADVQLDATVTDDGLPVDPGTYTMLWSVDSGPGGVEFSSETVEDPVATFTAAGDYVLRLAADDGELVGEDTVKIQIYEEDYTGLLALWPLDENADDIIGGHDGMLKGDATIDTDSQVGTGSVLLDGLGDYIDIQDSGHATNTTWADLTDEVTVTAWIKVNKFDKDWQSIVCKGNRSYRLQRNWDTNGLIFAFDIQDPSDPEISYDVIAWGQMNVNDGKWHHVAGTYDAEEIRLYIDGVLDSSSQAFEFEMMEVTAHLAIGENLEYPTSFNGRIDQVRIYEIGLPGDKILQEFIDDGGSNSCGQVYATSDVNKDCYTNIEDIALIAVEWLNCRDVTNPLCSTE